MKVTQEKLPASQLGLEIEVTPEMSKQAYEKAVRDYSRTVNIPGFRKGKVPRQVLIQRLGANRIKMAVLEDLIDTSVRQAIDQEKIDALGNFQLRSSFEELTQQFEPGKPLTFSASVDVPPEVALETYSGLTIQAEEVTYDPAKVDDVLEDYRNRVATLVPVEERPVQMGDIAIVDFDGTYIPAEGEAPIEIPGGSAQDFQLEMKEDQFIEGFVEGVVGMNTGETKELSLTFPENYSQEKLAGKPATFSVTLKDIKEKDLPDLDDDFAQEVSEFETLQELRETLEKRYQNEAEQKTKENKTAAIFDELLKQIDVDLPESMIKREVDFVVTQSVMQLESRGLDVRKILNEELVEGMRERARPEAVTRLKRTMALGEIAKQESIEVSDDELEAKVTEFMQNYKDQEVDPQRVREVMKDELLEEKVLRWVEANSTIELVPEGTLSTGATDNESMPESSDAVTDEQADAPPASEPASEQAVEPSDEQGGEQAPSDDAASTSFLQVDTPQVDTPEDNTVPDSDSNPGVDAEAAVADEETTMVDVNAMDVEEPEVEPERSAKGKKPSSPKTAKEESPKDEVIVNEPATEKSSVEESSSEEEAEPKKKTTRSSKSTKTKKTSAQSKKSSRKSSTSDGQSTEGSES